jgi:hypothetical protein
MEMEGHVMDLKYVCYNDWDKMCGNWMLMAYFVDSVKF